jgi:branched-chain amino acid transport system substrate-binding protein
MTNPVSFVALPIKIAQEQKFKKVAVILIDIPAAAGQVKAIADPVFAKAGLTASYTAVKPGTPDMTPQVQAALSGGNQEFLIVGDPAFCISALKSLKTLSFSGPIIINSQCLSPDVPKAVPGGVDNIIVGTSESLDPDDAEVKLYDTIMAKYAPGQAPHASATDTAYGAIMGFVRAMTGATGDVTPASVVATFGSMAPQPMPLLHGSTFQCNRKASTLTPAVCTTGIAMVTLDAKGNAKKTEPIDATKYISLGS